MIKFAMLFADNIGESLPLFDTRQPCRKREWSHNSMALKPIAIEQLIPGMYVVEMDLPWYRTPFLSHKLLIKDVQTVQTMKQHGIKKVTIDTSKGCDLPSPTSAKTSLSQDSAAATSAAPVSSAQKPENNSDATRGNDLSSPTPAETGLPPDTAATVSVAPISSSQKPEHTSEPARQLASVIYAQAQEAVERIFDDLERGVPPSPEATKKVVSNVLTQVLSDRAAMATQVAIQQIKQFDRSLGAHALDTCILALVVAIESGLDPAMQEQVGTGALLHDAGYVRLPRNLVRKRDECSGQDKILLQQHTKLGVALLSKQSGIHEDVLRVVGEHHERANGSGFPAGLRNEAISQFAKIIGIVDYYDGLVSRRGAKPPMIPHDAVRQLFLTGESGQFEKSLVEIMIRSIGVYPVGSLVRLNTGEQAVVVGVNPQQRLKPLVKVTTDPQGRSYAVPIQLDLGEPSSHDHTVRSVLRVLDPVQERVNVGIHLDHTQSQAA